jgi:hypothetical protein
MQSAKFACKNFPALLLLRVLGSAVCTTAACVLSCIHVWSWFLFCSFQQMPQKSSNRRQQASGPALTWLERQAAPRRGASDPPPRQ